MPEASRLGSPGSLARTPPPAIPSPFSFLPTTPASGTGRLVKLELAVAQRDGDLDHLAVGREGLAGSLLESLHGVHELELVVGVLFLERGGIDSPAPLLAGAAFAGGWSGGQALPLGETFDRRLANRRSNPDRRSWKSVLGGYAEKSNSVSGGFVLSLSSFMVFDLGWTGER